MDRRVGCWGWPSMTVTSLHCGREGLWEPAAPIWVAWDGVSWNTRSMDMERELGGVAGCISELSSSLSSLYSLFSSTVSLYLFLFLSVSSCASCVCYLFHCDIYHCVFVTLSRSLLVCLSCFFFDVHVDYYHVQMALRAGVVCVCLQWVHTFCVLYCIVLSV